MLKNHNTVITSHKDINTGIGVIGARILILILCACFFISNAGCSGSKLPANDNSSIAALKAAEPSVLKKEFIDLKLIPALESKNPEKIKGLFDRTLSKTVHWKSFIDSACLLNKAKAETSGLHAAVKTAEDGFLISEVSFDYKLYGFTGLNYRLFVKEGRMTFSLKSTFGAGEAEHIIISDDFDKTWHLKGRVCRQNLRGVSGAAVTISSDKHYFSCTTGDDGDFSIEFIPAADFAIKIDKPGYIPVEKKITALKKGEYFTADDLILKRITSGAGTPSANGGIENNDDDDELLHEGGLFYLTPGAETFNNGLSAAASDKSVKLSWNGLKSGGAQKQSYSLYRKALADENFKMIHTAEGIDGYTDEGLVNAAIYIYKVEARGADPLSPPAAVFGPVTAIPASLKFAVEFEDIVSNSLKWSGAKPLIINEKLFSGGRYIAFDPLKTAALSFLTPQKIKTGYYKAFLYVKRTDGDSALKIEIKQFGEPEDNKAFYRGEISLKSPGDKENRDVIELGEMLIEPKSWKNETIGEDYCEMSINISQSENGETTEEKSNKKTAGRKISLDVIEFIKVD
jgi:hypothetical protein